MKRRVLLSVTAAALAAAGAIGGVMTAPSMGPPMICHPIDVGGAPTIAERGASVKDVLAALDKAESTLVRMEVLRRASVAAESGGVKASGLLHALMARAMDASAAGKKERVATAYFDAAYLIGCLRQYGDEVGKGMGVTDGVDGYAWMKHAIAQGTDTSMHFGAALLVHPAMHRGMGKAYREHMASARAGAAAGSLVAKNIETHSAAWDRYLSRDDEGKQ